MHVSSRYLDLTKNKLELTRMPREVGKTDQEKWELGTPKGALEPLIDYWLESYDWRAQEAFFNSTLQQYRTVIEYPPRLPSTNQAADLDIDIEAAAATPDPEPEKLRIHFLHHRSSYATAIPMLYCHTWPGSFLEVSRCLDALVSPPQTPTQQPGGGAWRDPVAFDVVVPSLPGFGFSDASSSTDFGLKETAGVFVQLMKRLGYERFVVWGDSWGFKIARMLAIHHPTNIAAIYTSRIPDLPTPQALKHKDAWFKYQIARLTGARFPWLSFGYTSSDFGAADMSIADEPETIKSDVEPEDIELGESVVVLRQGSPTRPPESSEWGQRRGIPSNFISRRPQTLSYGLCDSPSGLLALILDALKPTITYTAPATAQRQPQSRHRSNTVLQYGMPTIDETIPPPAIFTPADILNWTMMYWLPGPEASLRWLRTAEKEDCYSDYSEVPLGITWYAAQPSGGPTTPPAKLVRGVSSLERMRARSRSPGQTTEPAPNAPTSPPASVASPMWASAIHNLKWVKRRNEDLEAGVSAWEESSEVVQDVREFFELGRSEGWLGL